MQALSNIWSYIETCKSFLHLEMLVLPQKLILDHILSRLMNMSSFLNSQGYCYLFIRRLWSKEREWEKGKPIWVDQQQNVRGDG